MSNVSQTISMIARFITIILMAVCSLGAVAAERVTASFCRTPLPTALKTIEQLSDDNITINFSFRKLEDYTVTTDIVDATPLEAIHQVIGFYPIKVSVHGDIVTVQPRLECKHKITGRLIDNNGDGVDFASITVRTVPDSAVVASGVSNVRGDFVVPTDHAGPMVLCIKRIGYKAKTLRAHTGNMGDIMIETDPYVLKALTVYSDHHAISTVGAVTHIQIEGTPFSKIGTLGDLLPNLPGFNTSTHAFGNFGTGNTIYYINGREVSETTQLNMLRSDDVKSITIDRAPGAEYPTDAAVVVNISTIKSPDDYMNLRINNVSQIRKRFSDMPSVDFKLQLGKFITTLNYEYDYLQSKTGEDYSRTINLDRFAGSLVRRRMFANSDKGSKLNWSGEWQIDRHNRLGMYYYYYSLDHEISGEGNNIITANNAHDIKVLSNKFGESSLHSGSISYDYTGKAFTAHVAQDLAYTNPNTSLQTTESQDKSTFCQDNRSDEYNVSTTNVRLGLNLPTGTVVNGGGRLSYIESNANKRYFHNSQNGYYDGYFEEEWGYGAASRYNKMHVTETTAQAYMSLSQRVGNVTIAPGVRYEYITRKINDVSTIADPAVDANKPIKQELTYDNVFRHLLPTLMVKYSNGRFCAVLNYSRRMVQPTFSMLNSGLVYEDNYTYTNSNPNLKPTQIDDMRLSANYRGFAFDMGYKRMGDLFAEVEVPTAREMVVHRVPINLKRYTAYDLNIAYSSTIGALGCYASAGMIIPRWNKIAYGNPKLTFNAELNLNYTINRTFSLYTNLKHYGASRMMVYDKPGSQIWNFGVNASLLNNRLTVNIEATNILNRNRLHDITTTYNDIRSIRCLSTDTRGVSVRVSYTLFNKQIRSKVKRGNVDDIDRIER